MFSRIIGLSGQIHLRLVNEANNFIEEIIVPNLIVDAGIDHITKRLDQGLPVSPMIAIAIGDDATAAAAGQVDLQGTELARVSMIAPYPQATGGNQVVYQAAFGPGVATSPPDIVEAGIFNNAAAGPASGDMLARGTFGAITKGAGDTLTVTWTLQFTAV